MRIFLDANILYSATVPGSATARLLQSVLKHSSAVANDHVLQEARRNIAIKSPGQLSALGELEQRIEVSPGFVHLPECSVLPDKDHPVLCGAVASRCTHLWTSDRRHFGSLYGKVIHGTRVVSSIMLADELADLGWLR